MDKSPGKVSDVASHKSGKSAISLKTDKSKGGDSIATKISRLKKKLDAHFASNATKVSATDAN